MTHVDLQIVHTGARNDKRKANPLGQLVRLTNPPKVNAAVLSSCLLAIGKPMIVTSARRIFKMTLGVWNLAKRLVPYAQIPPHASKIPMYSPNC